MNTAVYNVTSQNFNTAEIPKCATFLKKHCYCCSSGTVQFFPHLSFLLIQLSYRSSKHMFLQSRDKRCLPLLKSSLLLKWDRGSVCAVPLCGTFMLHQGTFRPYCLHETYSRLFITAIWCVYTQPFCSG